MLANDVAVAALRSDVQSLADLETKPTGVEHRATANHLVMRQSAQLPSHVRQDVNLAHTHTHTPHQSRYRRNKQVYIHDRQHAVTH